MCYSLCDKNQCYYLWETDFYKRTMYFVAKGLFLTFLIISVNGLNDADSPPDEFPIKNFTSGINKTVLTKTVSKKYVKKDSQPSTLFPGQTEPADDVLEENKNRVKSVYYNVTTNTNNTTPWATLSANVTYFNEEAANLYTNSEGHPTSYNKSETVPQAIPKGTKIDDEVEEIQDGTNTEENRRHNPLEMKTPSSSTSGTLHGQLVGIVVGSFVVFSVFVYVGLLSYRKYLENRYGSRQLLVEDEFYSPAGMQNFSI
ncbi:uncharacterized protein LOC109606458 [Aethina tumida]|uniref:uncharacterized protein LOC109606458 n=1 Tax=Aethina tumida TaxID=116153 RepID=UPI002148CCC4|nr:uncharacterized protein LOC109606458 [Aethina tumida]